MVYEQEYIDKLRELREKGLTVQEIADAMGKTKKTMQRHLHDVGLTQWKDRSDIKDEDILHDWNELHLTVNQIAQKYDCSHDTITKRLAKYDIKSDRVEGIRKHFAETYKERWPLIKADLDKGICVTLIREKYHIRIENLKELMEQHHYIQNKGLPLAVYDELLFRIETEKSKPKPNKSLLFYLESVRDYVDTYHMLPSVNGFLDFTGRAGRNHVMTAIRKHDLGLFIDTGRTSSWVAYLQEYLNRHHVNYELNNRKILKTENGTFQELDFYLPDFHIGIEVNPVGTHSIDTKLGIKDVLYHQNKSLLACKTGVGLVHMYDADFVNTSQFEKIMRQILTVEKRRIGARKCALKEVSKTDANVFLDKYHLQGREQGSKYRYGLYDGNELCCLLTIGKSRFTHDDYEILRYCVRPDYAISGGFQKLFHYFLKKCKKGMSIVSYMDLNKRYCCESIYEKAGFAYQGLTSPDYKWVKKYGTETLNRYDTMKRKLVAQGFDENQTEVQIMRSRDFYRVYGAGAKKFVYVVK